MRVGDLECAVSELLDRGRVLGDCGLVYGVNDLGLCNRSVLVDRELVLRQGFEIPRPVGSCSGGGSVFLLAVGLEYNGNALRADSVFVVGVCPLFDTFNLTYSGT